MMSENQTATQVEAQAQAQPATPDMVTMFTAALTEIINRMVDKRVNEVLANVVTTQMMDSAFEERVQKLLDSAVENLDLGDAVESAFRYSVEWEDMVDERVREQVEELVPSDDDLHDKVRDVLNDVTFTVSVD